MLVLNKKCLVTTYGLQGAPECAVHGLIHCIGCAYGWINLRRFFSDLHKGQKNLGPKNLERHLNHFEICENRKITFLDATNNAICTMDIGLAVGPHFSQGKGVIMENATEPIGTDVQQPLIRSSLIGKRRLSDEGRLSDEVIVFSSSGRFQCLGKSGRWKNRELSETITGLIGTIPDDSGQRFMECISKLMHQPLDSDCEVTRVAFEVFPGELARNSSFIMAAYLCRKNLRKVAVIGDGFVFVQDENPDIVMKFKGDDQNFTVLYAVRTKPKGSRKFDIVVGARGGLQDLSDKDLLEIRQCLKLSATTSVTKIPVNAIPNESCMDSLFAAMEACTNGAEQFLQIISTSPPIPSENFIDSISKEWSLKILDRENETLAHEDKRRELRILVSRKRTQAVKFLRLSGSQNSQELSLQHQSYAAAVASHKRDSLGVKPGPGVVPIGPEQTTPKQVHCQGPERARFEPEIRTPLPLGPCTTSPETVRKETSITTAVHNCQHSNVRKCLSVDYQFLTANIASEQVVAAEIIGENADDVAGPRSNSISSMTTTASQDITGYRGALMQRPRVQAQTLAQAPASGQTLAIQVIAAENRVTKDTNSSTRDGIGVAATTPADLLDLTAEKKVLEMRLAQVERAIKLTSRTGSRNGPNGVGAHLSTSNNPTGRLSSVAVGSMTGDGSFGPYVGGAGGICLDNPSVSSGSSGLVNNISIVDNRYVGLDNNGGSSGSSSGGGDGCSGGWVNNGIVGGGNIANDWHKFPDCVPLAREGGSGGIAIESVFNDDDW